MKKIILLFVSLVIVSCTKEEIENYNPPVVDDNTEIVDSKVPQKIYNSSTLNHEWNDGWVTFKTQRIESEFWSAFTYFDYNLDGKMDVFFRGWTPDNSNPIGVNIMTDGGWKNVPNVVDFQSGRAYRKIVTADVDNDGDLDMICFLAEDPGQSKQNGNRIMGGLDIYRFKEGKFYYEEIVPYQEGMKFFFHGGVVGDINGDGWVDILASGTSGSKVYMNKKDGTFDTNYFEVTQMTDSNPSPGSSTFTLELADLNNDGILDLMTGLARNGYYFPHNQPSEYPKYNYTSHIYFGKSEYPYFVETPLVLDTDFSKSTPEEMKYSFNITYDYVVSDMDEDGDLDIFVYLTNDDSAYNPGDLNYKNDAALEYHENNGDGTFNLKNDIFKSGHNVFATGPNWFKGWDIDNDGKKEILLEAYDRLPFNAWKKDVDGKYYKTTINN